MSNPITYVVQHLDPELGDWSKAEYLNIADEAVAAGSRAMITCFPPNLANLPEFEARKDLVTSAVGIQDMATRISQSQICLLDPAAETGLSPADRDDFTYFLFGGILGDDPPRDRTSELRKLGYKTRNLGSVQMTTDTAVRVTRMVVEDQKPLNEILYVDHPDIKIDKHESIEMPFRYVKAADGKPALPPGMVDLLKKDSDKGVDDLL